jgi:2-iminobutanoate/2-iminopropanoate deaminase
MRRISTTGAPAALGPYSQGIVHGGLVYTCGQLGLDPATGALVPGGAGPEFERAAANIAAILHEAGSGMERVLRLTLYLVDLADFAAVNAVCERVFREPFPARETVQVCRLPKDARVEVAAVAALRE